MAETIQKGKNICTFGYGNRTSYSDLEAAISEYDIHLVVDVRKKPRGWSPLWSNFGLSKFCDSIGIEYLSKTALGNNSGNSKWLPPNPDEAESALNDVSIVSMNYSVLLLCAEKDWRRCHRAAVAERIADKTGNPVVHL
ncbi:MAG: DUF488 domain-containing protein [Cyanobacteria bacterium P01_C01_bin.70]